MQIDPVEKRATDFSHVTLDLQWRAVAISAWVRAVTAGTRIERRNEHKIGWVGRAGHRATDRHGAILKWLSQHFERTPVEFWKFIEKQHAMVRKTDLAGCRWRTSTGKACVTDRMVRFPKGSRGEEWCGGIDFS